MLQDLMNDCFYDFIFLSFHKPHILVYLFNPSKHGFFLISKEPYLGCCHCELLFYLRRELMIQGTAGAYLEKLFYWHFHFYFGPHQNGRGATPF